MKHLVALAAATGLLAAAGGASACDWHKTTASLAHDSMAQAEPSRSATSEDQASKIIGNGSPLAMSKPALDATMVANQTAADPQQ